MPSSNGNGNGNGHKPPTPPAPAVQSPADRAADASTLSDKGKRNTPLTPDTPLSPRELLFLDAYLMTLSPSRAAKAAGYKAKSARVFASMAHQVLARPNVQAELQRAFIRRMERSEITQDRVLRDIDLAAHVDPAELLSLEGKMLDLRAIPRHVREAIEGLEFHEDGRLKHIKLRSTTPFHILLAKHTRVGVEAPPPSLLDVPAFVLPEGTYMRVH